jgi:large subunit ribosomal protein L4
MNVVTVDTKVNVDLSEQVFGKEFNNALIHQVLSSTLAGYRAGTKAQKNRGALTRTNSKPWAQKGTGRARAGDRKGPIMVGGGVTFAQRSVRDYSQKINKKMYKGAMRSILSTLVKEERIIVVEDLKISDKKTKNMSNLLAGYNITKGLIIHDYEGETADNIFMSSRNIKNIFITDANYVDVHSLLAADKVLINVSALKKIEERLL